MCFFQVKEVQDENSLLAFLVDMNGEGKGMRTPTRYLLLLALILAVGWKGPVAAADDSSLPKVRVENVRRVFWNGEHNAFTDLILQ